MSLLTFKEETASSISMKKVGLISDTHIPTRASKIPLKVFEVFQNVDSIIHAGDLVKWSVITKLEKLAPVCAVYGNMDGIDIRERLPKINELKIFDWKIGVIHNPGVLFGSRTMREIVKEHNYDVLVHGHTHHSSIRWENMKLFINPGSPTNPIPPFITKSTIAILKLTREKIQTEIIVLEK